VAAGADLTFKDPVLPLATTAPLWIALFSSGKNPCCCLLRTTKVGGDQA